MREIKFRAWNSGTKKMVDLQAISALATELPGLFIPNVAGMELMQYTGLKDKTGKEIYEGDVVRCDYASNVNPQDHDDSNYFDNRKRIGLIEWKVSEGRWTYKGEAHYRMDETYQMEVIGNVWENPELLK